MLVKKVSVIQLYGWNLFSIVRSSVRILKTDTRQLLFLLWNIFLKAYEISCTAHFLEPCDLKNKKQPLKSELPFFNKFSMLKKKASQPGNWGSQNTDILKLHGLERSIPDPNRSEEET